MLAGVPCSIGWLLFADTAARGLVWGNQASIKEKIEGFAESSLIQWTNVYLQSKMNGKTKKERKALWEKYLAALDRLAHAHIAHKKSKKAVAKTNIRRAQRELKEMEEIAWQLMDHDNPGVDPAEIDAAIVKNRKTQVYDAIDDALEERREIARVRFREYKLDPRVRAQRAKKARRDRWLAKWRAHRAQGQTKARRLVCSMAISA